MSMNEPKDTVAGEAIASRLTTKWAGRTLHYTPEVDSTNRWARDLARQGASMEQYLAYRNITDEQLRAEMRPQAEATGKASAVLASIAQQEGIVITDEDVDNDVRRMAMMYQMDYDKLAGTMDEAARESVRNSLEISKALQLVFDASIEE